jgi:nicotinamide-nucleotide amidase
VKAEIIAVGTELLLGQIVDTNSAYLARELAELGIDLYWVTHVGDNLERLADAISRALSRSDLVILTGGLGPTEDDLTRDAIARVLGEDLYIDPELEQRQRAFWAARGLEMPPRNLTQAMLIPSARPLPNPVGTAPGWWVEKDGKVIVAMPGVPRELTRMWEHEVRPRLRALTGTGIILSRTLKVIGRGESAVEEAIRPLVSSRNPTVATYAKPDGIHIRITAKAESPEAARALIEPVEAQVRAILGPDIYGADDATLEGTVLGLLRALGWRLGLIEVLTGGLLAAALSEPSDAEGAFAGALVLAGPSELGRLGFDAGAYREAGPGSLVLKLAALAREEFGADVGLATIGDETIGGWGEPPGAAFVGLDAGGETVYQRLVVPMSRSEVRRRAVLTAFHALWRALRGRLQAD